MWMGMLFFCRDVLDDLRRILKIDRKQGAPVFVKAEHQYFD